MATDDKPIENTPTETPALKPLKQKPTLKNKKLFLIILLFVLLLGGGVTAFLLMKKQPKNSQPTPQNNSVNQEAKVDEAKPLVPSTIVYAHGDATKEGTKVFWRPAAGGDKMEAYDPGKNTYVGEAEVYRNKVVIETEPAAGNKSGPAIWYSQDFGKSYSKIFEGEAPKADGFGAQLTTLKFSSNGEAVVFGYLPEAGKGNTVKAIDLVSKSTKDLFSIEQSGVFLHGYDSTKQLVYYDKGCFNCDGVRFNHLIAHDVAKNADTTLYDVDKVGADIVMNNDLTKVLRAMGPENPEGLGSTKPYTIDEFDIASKTAKTLTTIDEKVPIRVGYQSNNQPYYVKGKTIYAVDGSAKTTTLFESSKDIQEVLYIGSDQIIVSTGSFEDFVLINYNVATKQVINILSGDSNTRLFGVTLGN